MCCTMAYLSAHYGALLDIGWCFGGAAVVFALKCVFICQLALSPLTFGRVVFFVFFLILCWFLPEKQHTSWDLLNKYFLVFFRIHHHFNDTTEHTRWLCERNLPKATDWS